MRYSSFAPMEKPQTTTTKSTQRLFPIDALRGLIIILMALDHANFFIAQLHSPGEYWGGPFPTYSSPAPFLTRFVTHICAPGFFFLMGTGMVLFKQSRLLQGWRKVDFYKHFILRGVLLIALQFFLVNRFWELAAGGWPLRIYVGVLFALGAVMIVGSVLIWLNKSLLLLVTLSLLILTEILVPDPSRWGQIVDSNWLHVAELFVLTPGGTVPLWSNYPVLPWLEFAVFGMLFGYLLIEKGKGAYRWALTLGGIFLLLFIFLRRLSGFGNIRPLMGESWIHFLNLVKYPPSLTYTLLTLGLTLLLLWLLAQVREDHQKYLRPLVVFGRTPLFFYLIHLALYAIMGRVLTPNGTALGPMYFFWLVGLLLLYPLCAWFGKVKNQQLPDSILRFF